MTATITINGRKVTVPENATILEAARAAGITIPTLCHHPDLSNVGACRMCVVSVERARGGVYKRPVPPRFLRAWWSTPRAKKPANPANLF
jgi:NADH dehydrogenase/NADH:ubiquinone oxidoreductase subunit G